MVHIGALLFRVKANNDKTQFVMIPKMLKDLVPNDQLKAMSENEWKKVRRAFFSLPGILKTSLFWIINITFSGILNFHI